MPHSPKTQFLTHTFAGGWATDYGPTSRVGPDQGGNVAVPFLSAARNIEFDLTGAVRKAPGTSAHSDSAYFEPGGFIDILGVYDFWRQSGGSTQHSIVVHTSSQTTKFGEIRADHNADGAYSTLFYSAGGSLVEQLFTENFIPNYNQFDDFLIIGTYGNAGGASYNTPHTFDLTTYQRIGGGAPSFGFSCTHKSHVFAAGDPANPSRLYYCVPGNPEDWTGVGSGSIDISLGDGDAITGLVSYKGVLIIFKGPYKGSIHRLNGSTDADFSLDPLSTSGVTAAWQNSIFQFGDDIGFVSPRGTVHSLSATDKFGGLTNAYLSLPINNYLKSHLNYTRHKYWWAVTNPSTGQVFITVSKAGSAKNNLLLVMDYRFLAMGESSPRWSYWDYFNAQSLALGVEYGNQHRILAGDDEGNIWKLDYPTRNHDGEGITATVTTPFLNYGDDYNTKTLNAISMGIVPRNDNDVDVTWTRDTGLPQTLAQSQAAEVILDVFQLDVDYLTDGVLNPRFVQTEEGGSFRSVQYSLTDDNLYSNFELYSIGALVTVDSPSMENS